MLQAGGGVWKGDSWGTQRVGGLTEAQIREELQNSGVDEIPLSVRNASNTISWWRGRQAVLDLKVGFRLLLLHKRCHDMFYWGGGDREGFCHFLFIDLSWLYRNDCSCRLRKSC